MGAVSGWWDMEEASSTRFDALGVSDLTDNNTVARNYGIVDYGAVMIRTNSEYLSHVDNAALSTGDISYTLASWVYMDTVTDAAIIDKANEYQIRNNSNQFSFEISNGAATDSIAVPTPNPAAGTTWYNVLGWYDQSGYIGSAANLAVATKAYANGGNDSGNPFYIGRDASGNYLDGRVDSVAILKNWVPNHDSRAWFYNGGEGRSYADFPTITPTPSPAPEPSATPTPGPQIYDVDLPGGGLGRLIASITAGEASVVLVGMALFFILAYRTLSDRIRPWIQR